MRYTQRAGVLLGLILLASTSASAISTKLLPQDVRIFNEQFVVPNGGMTPPRLAEYSQPAYTDEALARGIEGVVRFLAEFDINGNFKIIRMEKGLGFGLDENALNAVLQWHFIPAYRSGGRVSVISTIDVAFQLPPTVKNRPLEKNQFMEEFFKRRSAK